MLPKLSHILHPFPRQFQLSATHLHQCSLNPSHVHSKQQQQQQPIYGRNSLPQLWPGWGGVGVWFCNPKAFPLFKCLQLPHNRDQGSLETTAKQAIQPRPLSASLKGNLLSLIPSLYPITQKNILSLCLSNSPFNIWLICFTLLMHLPKSKSAFSHIPFMFCLLFWTNASPVPEPFC